MLRMEEPKMTQEEVNQAFEEKQHRKIFHPVKRHLKIDHEADK